MPDGKRPLARAVMGGIVSLVLCGSQAGRADEVKLKDGATVSATVLQRDGETVILQVPRASVELVNGAPLPPPVAAGTPAPEFTAVDLAGVTRTLSEHRGHPALVQFWASWCPHCRSDLSLVKQLFTQHQGKLGLVTVSIDQDLEQLQAFLKEQQVAFPVIAAASHPDLAERYEVQGVPAYYLIDADGVIAKTWSGSVTEHPSDFEEVVARLISGPAPQAAAAGSAN
ncbi:MAG: TlpA family protein disulfide reductase [Candidatus Omnitrophica bacterium]|nr:TlpA family protein disulfide reductase [Candidatus Omnitrophota bacterium]